MKWGIQLSEEGDCMAGTGVGKRLTIQPFEEGILAGLLVMVSEGCRWGHMEAGFGSFGQTAHWF